ncbi:cupin domain-containing protein [Egibacter rhizosphaerae]|uniref:Cupin domain-containing protein n=1 Tax=Egibacter rhizosphaerae TaxID=1670831 RepID=A0A411YFG0_9ACTN|nr:cupin domain-containing protein [Egibacter rhizosphaerae]QBI19968.1 cupin domain-containing protein [Egibacter rhizosphaerae]
MSDIMTDGGATLRLVAPGGGHHWWMLGTLTTIKVGGDATGGRMTIAEFELPPGFALPPHSHREEDELFYVLDGEVSFWCNGREQTFTRGGMAWLPRRRPHTFRVTDDGPARMFNIHTGPAFEAMVEALGERTDELRLPDPPEVEPDLERITKVFAQHGIDLVSPES